MTEPSTTTNNLDPEFRVTFPSKAIAVALVVAVVFLTGSLGYFSGRVANEERALSAADRGFLVDMIHHHDQAVLMARYATEHATTSTVRGYADDVIIFQRWEMGKMEGWLPDGAMHDHDGTSHMAMGWMGHPVDADHMPGLATRAELNRLYNARGPEIDRTFLRLMIRHHQAGVVMARAIVRRGSSPQVRDLARVMARNQRQEIAEYRRTLREMGDDGADIPELREVHPPESHEMHAHQ